jgi:predicted  nucleic acid-binding Zn-ribbon protein
MPTARTNKIKLNRISDSDRDSIVFVRSRLKNTDSILEQLHLAEKKRYTQAQLQAIDTAVAHINAVSNIMKQKREEIRERLQTDVLEFHNGPDT